MNSQVYLVYFVIILSANTIGAMSGIGGGIIIKPALDAIGYDPLSNILIYSSFAVFFMSIAATVKQYRNKTKIDIPTGITLALGSVIGGFLGNQTLNYVFSFISAVEIKKIQAVAMIIMIVLIYIYTQYIKMHLNKTDNRAILLMSGIILGYISTLLGIGGGPLNVALLIFIGFSLKSAMVYSVIIIFFAQLTLLTTTFVSGNMIALNPKLIMLCIMPAALIGGYIGGILNIKLKTAALAKLYNIVLFGVILLNIYNLFSN